MDIGDGDGGLAGLFDFLLWRSEIVVETGEQIVGFDLAIVLLSPFRFRSDDRGEKDGIGVLPVLNAGVRSTDKVGRGLLHGELDEEFEIEFFELGD